jgi:hypothetical protein
LAACATAEDVQDSAYDVADEFYNGNPTSEPSPEPTMAMTSAKPTATIKPGTPMATTAKTATAPVKTATTSAPKPTATAKATATMPAGGMGGTFGN